jgi:hypothetical protein
MLLTFATAANPGLNRNWEDVPGKSLGKLITPKGLALAEVLNYAQEIDRTLMFDRRNLARLSYAVAKIWRKGG